jgi:KDO2-lipid IV(A) lauroyltransferase
MRLRLQDVTSSRAMTRFGLWMARRMSRRTGYGAAQWAAHLIARRKPEIYGTVQANLRQIVGPEVGADALAQMTWRVFYHAGQTYYDFFHTVGAPREVVLDSVDVPTTLIEHIQGATAAGQGVLLLGTHMSNFDLVGLALGAHGLPIQVLSLTNPGEGFQVLNRLRATWGFEITPITPESLRAAIRRLRGGGIVLTGVDRPIPQDRELVEFLGRPAYLPVGPARLALMSNARVFVGSCRYDDAAGYALEYTGPIEMISSGDRREDILANTRRIAAVVERYVSAHPDQWMMFHPFWPDLPSD